MITKAACSIKCQNTTALCVVQETRRQPTEHKGSALLLITLHVCSAVSVGGELHHDYRGEVNECTSSV